ncbi:MAG: TonB-dependent receptor [Sphingobacterium sp.]|jgi:hypothetical protein|nr:TonB-dependent receptor [Sphingobacterium sp.]
MKIYIFFVSIFLLIVLANKLNAQTRSPYYTLSGKVEAASTQHLEVNLFDSASKLIKTEFVNVDGTFRFEKLTKGSYFLKISQQQSDIYNSEVFQLIDQNLLLPTIRVSENRLETVVITKIRPYIERQEGKIILNVENSLQNSGGTALEILEKAPGVNVDGNDNISLRGKGNLLIQINGKNTQLTADALVDYLRGIPAAVIEKIEFVTNPSSKYDAAGTSIINIKLKKGIKKGTNGTISAAAGMGRFIKNTNSISINHSNNAINLFANYNFAYREVFNDLVLDRSFYNRGDFTKAYLQDNFTKLDSRNHSARGGFDYDLNSKNLVGAVISFNGNLITPHGDSQTTILDEKHHATHQTATQSSNRNNWRNLGLNLNHKYRIDSLGSALNTDVDFIRYFNSSIQNFKTTTTFLDDDSNSTPYLLKGNISGQLNIYSLKSDLTKLFEQNWKLETGIKTSFVKSDNDMKFHDYSAQVPVLDQSKSNRYIYEEYIHAFYGSLSKKWANIKGTIGFRAEHTNVSGTQLTTGQLNKKHYLQFFPNVAFTLDINTDNSLEISVSRRITRPSYIQLNPFKYYINPTTYKTGNPELNAQTSQNIELTYSLKSKYIATLSYSKTSNNITSVVKPIVENGENITVQTDDNLKSAAHYGIYLLAPIRASNCWDINTNINLYYATYTGNISGTQIDKRGNINFDMNVVNSFKLSNNYTIELAANYRSAEVYAFAHILPLGAVNIAAQKKFKSNNALKLSMNDLFRTNYYRGNTVYNDYIENFNAKRDTRVIMLSYSYNFGAGKPVQSRRNGGAEDLKQRAE